MLETRYRKKKRLYFWYTLGLFNKKVDLFLVNGIKENNDIAREQIIILRYRINCKTAMIQQLYQSLAHNRITF